jgi:hypothetical protein
MVLSCDMQFNCPICHLDMGWCPECEECGCYCVHWEPPPGWEPVRVPDEDGGYVWHDLYGQRTGGRHITTVTLTSDRL